VRRSLLFVALVCGCARAGDGSRVESGAGGSSPTPTGSGATCFDGYAACAGQCVDLGSNSAHCGACGLACAAGEACVGGLCAASATETTGASVTTSTSVTASTSVAGSTGSGGGTCDPMFPVQVCGNGNHCQPTPDNNPMCKGPIGAGQQYSSCVKSADCGAAFECVNTPFKTTYCLHWCTSDLDCGDFDLCHALSPPLFAGGIEYGVCYDGNP